MDGTKNGKRRHNEARRETKKSKRSSFSRADDNTVTDACSLERLMPHYSTGEKPENNQAVKHKRSHKIKTVWIYICIYFFLCGADGSIVRYRCSQSRKLFAQEKKKSILTKWHNSIQAKKNKTHLSLPSFFPIVIESTTAHAYRPERR